MMLTYLDRTKNLMTIGYHLEEKSLNIGIMKEKGNVVSSAQLLAKEVHSLLSASDMTNVKMLLY